MSNPFRNNKDRNEAAREKHRDKVAWRNLLRLPSVRDLWFYTRLILVLALVAAALGLATAAIQWGGAWIMETGDFGLAFALWSCAWAAIIALIGVGAHFSFNFFSQKAKG